MSHTESQTNNKNYEARDAHVKPIAMAGIALFVLIFGALLVAKGVFHILENKRERNAQIVSPFMSERRLPVGPRLQVNPEEELAVFRAKEDSLVNSYGWVVKEAGVVHIPVDEAMKRMLEKGFPVRRQN